MKVAINRLTHIGDDVYGKRIEEEGMGNYEDAALAQNNAVSFLRWIQEIRLKPGELQQILGCQVQDITDFPAAIQKIKEAKGIK